MAIAASDPGFDSAVAVNEGLDVNKQPGGIRLEAVFKGELRTLIQFERK